MAVTPRSRVSCQVLLAGLMIVLSAVSCERGPRSSEAKPLLSHTEIGIGAEFGVRGDEDRLALLRRPMDAIFSGDEVLVPDAAPPWVRVFDREGHFLRAMVRRGEGASEVVGGKTCRLTNCIRRRRLARISQWTSQLRSRSTRRDLVGIGTLQRTFVLTPRLRS